MHVCTSVYIYILTGFAGLFYIGLKIRMFSGAAALTGQPTSRSPAIPPVQLGNLAVAVIVVVVVVQLMIYILH